jgi:hypothetical protein
MPTGCTMSCGRTQPPATCSHSGVAPRGRRGRLNRSKDRCRGPSARRQKVGQETGINAAFFLTHPCSELVMFERALLAVPQPQQLLHVLVSQVVQLLPEDGCVQLGPHSRGDFTPLTGSPPFVGKSNPPGHPPRAPFLCERLRIVFSCIPMLSDCQQKRFVS